MEKIELIESFNGVKIEPGIDYFVQVLNIGIEGKVAGIDGNRLIMSQGREYDLREVIGFGYETAQKYDFEKREIPLGTIRIFRKN